LKILEFVYCTNYNISDSIIVLKEGKFTLRKILEGNFGKYWSLWI